MAFRYIPLAFLLLLSRQTAQAQAKLNLDSCRSWARHAAPSAGNAEIIRQTSTLNMENLSKGYWPQFMLNAQATYQSDVTSLPIKLPMISVPSLNKDQYKAYAEINQAVYDGGQIRAQKNLLKNSAMADLARQEVDLYALEDRVIQLYFGLLFLDAQNEQLKVSADDVAAQLKRLSAARKEGTATQMSLDNLEAERIRLEQKITELQYNRRALLKVLSLLCGRSFEESSSFEWPQAQNASGERPEWAAFAARKRSLEAQNSLLNAKTMPRLSAFAQVGYGRPALNMLSNNFDSYYLAGLRLQWNLSSFYTLQQEKSLLQLQIQSLGLQEESFRQGQSIQTAQAETEAGKWKALQNSDEELLRLRVGIRQKASTQLSEGILTSADYVRELSNEENVRIQAKLHQLQYLQSLVQRQYAQGSLTTLR